MTNPSLSFKLLVLVILTRAFWMASGGAVESNALDTVAFGDPASESTHGLAAISSEVCREEWKIRNPGAIGGGVGMGKMGSGKADAFFFRHQRLAGDGAIQTRVASLDGGRQARSGVLMRESLDPGAKTVFVLDNQWDQFGPAVMTRAEKDGGARIERFTADRRPLWLRLERKGDTFTASASPDGQSWKTVATQTIPMGRTIYMGPATSMLDDKKLNEARFDHLTTSLPKDPWAAATVGTLELPGGAEPLGLGETSRRLLPLEPATYYGGDLTMKMRVDPKAQNYCTVKLWGSEGSNMRVVLTCEGQEVGMRHGAGVDIFVSAVGAVSPGAFWYRTTVLPKWLTEGKTSVEIKLRATGYLYAYGKVWNYDTYQQQMKEPTRGLYRLYTHTNPLLVPGGEVQGAAPDYAKGPVRKVDEKEGMEKFKSDVNERLQKILGNLNAGSGDVEFLANAYEVAWTAAYHSPETVQRLTAILDEACRKFNADKKHAGDEWGGAYGGHGVAVFRIGKTIGAQLNEAVDLGAGARSRREQWAAMLLASREFGRMNRKSIANQAIACDFSIYRANKGLLALGAAEAYPEARAIRYLRQAAGLEPYTYSEKPDGSTAPLQGPANTYRMVTSKGTTHEWNWCCQNCYGRMGPYVYEMYRLSGDPELRDRAVQMERAHISQIYPSVDHEGFRAMLNEGVICTRNVYHPGHPGYPYVNVTSALAEPVLVNGIRQQLADGQFFNSWLHSESSVYLPDDLDKIKAAAAKVPFRPLPTTPGQPDFAWADEQNAILTIKHGAGLHFITFARRSEAGIQGIADVHSLTPQFERVIQFAVEDIRIEGASESKPIGPEVQTPFTGKPPDNPVNAWAGQKLPLPPGRPGSPADFYGTRFGDFLIGMNSSYDKKFDFKPAGLSAGVDMISGKKMAAPFQVPPQTTVVFYAPAKAARPR